MNIEEAIRQTVREEIKKELDEFRLRYLGESFGEYPNTMTVKEAADFLRVSEATCYNMVRQKEIPYFRVRRRVFMKKDHLIEWMNNQKTTT